MSEESLYRGGAVMWAIGGVVVCGSSFLANALAVPAANSLDELGRLLETAFVITVIVTVICSDGAALLQPKRSACLATAIPVLMLMASGSVGGVSVIMALMTFALLVFAGSIGHAVKWMYCRYRA